MRIMTLLDEPASVHITFFTPLNHQQYDTDSRTEDLLSQFTTKRVKPQRTYKSLLVSSSPKHPYTLDRVVCRVPFRVW